MNSLIDVILPRRCACCKDLIASRRDTFCAICEQQLKHVSDFGERSLFLYAGVLRKLIVMAKFKPDESMSRTLARFLRQTLIKHESTLPFLSRHHDIVTYVPSHFRRRIARGHEFPALIAAQVAKQIKGPLAHMLFASRFDPPLSATPSAHARAEKVAGRYKLLLKLPPQRVLLVDDVMTTGATLKSAAEPLLESGHVVSCFTLAETSLTL